MNKIKFYVVLIIFGFIFTSISDDIDLTETEDLFSSNKELSDEINPILDQDPNKVISIVNGEKISLGEIQREMNAQLQRFGGQISSEQLSTIEQQLFEDVKNRIINNKLLLNAIKENEIIISDEDINNEILNIRNSLPEGTKLEDLLAAQGASIEDVKNDIKQQLSIAKIADSKTSNVLEISDAQAEEFYIQNPEGFQTPEEVEASHILLTVDANDHDDIKELKKAELLNIRNKILSGELSFENAAKEFSNCPSGERNSGSLGVFRKGNMVPEFEIAAFSQEIGEIGDIIETQFGYHIIKVANHTYEETISFDEAKEQIKNYLFAQNKQIAFAEYIKELRDSATIEDL